MSEKQELNRIALHAPAVLAAAVVVLDLFAYVVSTGSDRDIAATTTPEDFYWSASSESKPILSI